MSIRWRCRDPEFVAIVRQKVEELRSQRGTDFAYMPPFSTKTIQFKGEPAQLRTRKIVLEDGRTIVKTTLSQTRWKGRIEVYAEDGVLLTKDAAKQDLPSDLRKIFDQCG